MRIKRAKIINLIWAILITINSCDLNSKKKIEFNQYNQDGTLERTGYLDKDGKKIDTLKYFYPNGLLKRIEFYKNGKINGFKKVYQPNGELGQICEFLNDTLNGYCKNYNKNGDLESVAFFHQGKQLGDFYFYKKGIIRQYNFLGFQGETLNQLIYDSSGNIIMGESRKVFFQDTLMDDKIGKSIDSFHLRIMLPHPPKTSTSISVSYFRKNGDLILNERLDSNNVIIDIIKPLFNDLGVARVTSTQFDSIFNHQQIVTKDILF